MIRLGILTVSDAGSRGERADGSGDAIAAWAGEKGHAIAERLLVPDDTAAIAAVLVRWADAGGMDLILTTGGTGLTARDVTPEATRAVLDKEAPGIAEALAPRGVSAVPSGGALARRLGRARASPDREPAGKHRRGARRARGAGRPRGACGGPDQGKRSGSLMADKILITLDDLETAVPLNAAFEAAGFSTNVISAARRRAVRGPPRAPGAHHPHRRTL